jgi:hypothetical protein
MISTGSTPQTMIAIRWTTDHGTYRRNHRAVGNNGIGIAGVNWVVMMACKFIGRTAPGPSPMPSNACSTSSRYDPEGERRTATAGMSDHSQPWPTPSMPKGYLCSSRAETAQNVDGPRPQQDTSCEHPCRGSHRFVYQLAYFWYGVQTVWSAHRSGYPEHLTERNFGLIRTIAAPRDGLAA